ncbi:sodium/glutamate symporter [Oceanobacillus sp. FSL K6-2867]|uniref:sodium/glutamate symporter n=1 Tax=Oceanobacillus sp. FSL K6-2867 TaxID=2954748 RepID=UPI0030DB833D
MEFTPWTIFIDFGFICLLLVVGTLLRAKIKAIQFLFLPASLLAGLMGLILGPNGFGIIPFSDNLSTYTSILIALIFGSLPLSAAKIPIKGIANRIGSMWSFAQSLTIFQWGGGMLFALLVLKLFWTDIPNGFGLVLAAGFVGGHGTAAAIGDAFSDTWADAGTLAMTSATMGIICAIVGGLFLIKRSTIKGQTSYISDFKSLPGELRSGLVPKGSRGSIGDGTVSSISIDPLVYHLALIGVIATAGYYLSEWGTTLFPQISIPVFSTAFIAGLIINRLLRTVKASDYVDKQIIDRISGAATDLLVAFGIASINLAVVVNYALPLALLLVFGLLLVTIFFYFIAPRLFKENWFEKAIFSWGWGTGTVAMGIALLRIVDPELKSKTLDDYALAYVGVGTVDILIVSLAPVLIMTGQHWPFTLVALAIGTLVLILSKWMGWWSYSAAKQESRRNIS